MAVETGFAKCEPQNKKLELGKGIMDTETEYGNLWKKSPSHWFENNNNNNNNNQINKQVK